MNFDNPAWMLVTVFSPRLICLTNACLVFVYVDSGKGKGRFILKICSASESFRNVIRNVII